MSATRNSVTFVMTDFYLPAGRVGQMGGQVPNGPAAL